MVVDLCYAEDLAGEDLAEIDLSFADTDAPTACDADGSVMERVIRLLPLDDPVPVTSARRLRTEIKRLRDKSNKIEAMEVILADFSDYKYWL